jgi:hypothetical protein
MGWIVAVMHAKKGRTSTSPMRLLMGRDTNHEERRLRSPWWMGGAHLSYGPHDGKRECAREERRLRSLCWRGGSVRRQLFVVHAKEGQTKTAVVIEINTSSYAART